MSTIRRHRLLGLDLDLVTTEQLNAEIERAVAEGARTIIANHNLHSLRLCLDDEGLRDFFQAADIVHIDGMAIVFLGRLLGLPTGRAHRTTYVDWFPALASVAADRGWRVFYCGSRPGVAARGAELLRARFPGLEVRTSHGYLDDSSVGLRSEEVIEQINSYRPHLLFIGMGMPRQEQWIQRHATKLEANVILPCGAAMDYVAGAVPTPPRWLGKVGLEWLFRLCVEPRRLAHRYLLEPWALVRPVGREVVAQRIGRWRQRSSAAT